MFKLILVRKAKLVYILFYDNYHRDIHKDLDLSSSFIVVQGYGVKWPVGWGIGVIDEGES